MEFLLSSEMKCPKSVLFQITGWDELGKGILNETLFSTILV